MLGEIVGSYRIERELGIGGMGAVYLAKHTILDKYAAVKMLRPKWSSDQEAVDRFFTEATATTAVRHGGIVDVYDFGHHPNGSAYLVMELLEGETLGEKLRREDRIPEQQALSFGWQAMRALAAAHAADIVHRDLKPDNIFLTDDPAAVGGVRVKLLDFGIAKLRGPKARRHTSPGELVGTPLFMSPEHCLGKELDGRSDVYSIACVLFYAISGRPPFVSEDYAELLHAHVGKQPPHLTEVFSSARPEVSDLLFRCLRKNPDERPDAAEFAEALRSLAEAPLEVTVPPASKPPVQVARAPEPPLVLAPEPSGRVVKANSWKVFALASAVLLAAAVVIVVLARSGGGDASESAVDLATTPAVIETAKPTDAEPTKPKEPPEETTTIAKTPNGDEANGKTEVEATRVEPIKVKSSKTGKSGKAGKSNKTEAKVGPTNTANTTNTTNNPGSGSGSGSGEEKPWGTLLD